MKLVKRISDKKYVSKVDNKEYNYKSYILILDNKKEIPIAPAIFGSDDKSKKWRSDLYTLLDNVSEIESK